jgi:hypothetical protein
MNIPDEKPRIRVRAGTAADIKRELHKAADKIDDLLDVVDHQGVRATPDMWNVADPNRARNVVTGIPLAASGQGAEDAVHEYSKDTRSGNSITEAYRMFAEQIGNMSTRMEASEKAIVSVSQLLASFIKGERFPEDETEKKGDESDKKDDEKEDDEAAKSIPTLSVPGLMRALSGVSRSSVPSTLATPPSMVTIKARRDSLQDILDQDDGRSFPMHARMELASIQAAMANLDGGQMRDSHLNNLIRRASPQAREALVKANITF